MTDNLRNSESKHVAAKTLWSDADKTRQFLIPDTLELPSGESLLRTATGRKQCVNLAVLSSFEVSTTEAQTWAKTQLGEVTRRLEAGLQEVLVGASERVQGQGKYPGRAS